MSAKSNHHSTEARILELERELKTLRLVKTGKATSELSFTEEEIFDSVPEGITIVGRQGQVIFTNKAAVLQHGYSQEEIAGESCSIFFKEATDVNAFKRQLDKTFAAGSGNSSEYLIVQKNGDNACFSINFSLRKSTLDDSIQFIVVHRNITEQKATDLALQESEEKFRSLVENSPDIIMNVDRDGNILFMNRSVTDVPISDIVGNKVYDYTLPDQHEIIRKEIEYTFETGKEGSYEISNTGSDNVVRWFSTRTAPIKKKGAVSAVTLDCRDVTKKRSVDVELRQSEELLRSILSSTAGLLNVLDRDFNIIYS
ncbi:PAS domain-containing protein, partial [bacterium]|nr:PAS domain-containing protein [bacterium]